MSKLKNQEIDSFDHGLDEDEDSDVTGPQKLTENDLEMSPSQLENYIDDIADTVRVGLDQSIAILTPWFFNNMPKIYYQTTPRQEKVRHLSAIITGHVFETKQTVELWDRDRTKVTYIGPGGDKKILVDMAKKLYSHEIKMGGVYFSRDRLLFLSTFFCDKFLAADKGNPRIIEKVQQAEKNLLEQYPDQKKEVQQYIENLDNEYVMYATINRLCITFRMVRHMMAQEGAYTFLEPFENSSAARLTLGLKNTNPAEIMEPVLNLIHRYDFTVVRAFVVRFDAGYDESITVMHFILNHVSGEKITGDMVAIIRLIKALRTLGWVDNDEYSVFTQLPYDFSINAANLIRSMATWCHIFLSKRMAYAYSLYRICNCFLNNLDLTRAVVELFRLRFDPLQEEERANGLFERKLEEIEGQVAGVIEDIDRSIFKECIRFTRYCLKTNYFLNTKTGHAFRMDPDVLDQRFFEHKPFGFYFISGRNFRAFQVRWKDVARGGMRVVMSRNPADYEYALAGLFDEVYGLSFAQQLKNKDIPEGGSKAVLVLKPGGHRDQAVKACVNALLDLLVDHDESHESEARAISYYEGQEIIYLGPDENITNDLINWITHQAQKRNYKYWAAFMSSKPGAGINHKEFGVTSEGVNVYVDNTLHYLGIDPKRQSFTVKLTGGPDGDVAGNELKILHREYGENARVVAISDGLGCAFDPKGLNWQELLRLVHESLSIVNFSQKELSDGEGAFVISADTNENIRIRNEIYFKAYADIFIPAGGRPYSVNRKNWKSFLDEKGKPSVRAIVEGANIFFSGSARTDLQKYGVVIVKDSSANKTGVICSSYEIIASLTMSESEFTEIKQQYVGEVVEILRKRADLEAKLLFRELAASDGGKNMVDLSLEVSKEINGLTDILLEELTGEEKELGRDPIFQDIILRHCPPILVNKYKDRIFTRLPIAHQIAIVASFISSYVVYREGLAWMKAVPSKHRATAMRIYIQMDKLASKLQAEVSNSSVEEKSQLNAILEKSAARDLTMMELIKRSIIA